MNYGEWRQQAYLASYSHLVTFKDGKLRVPF